MSGDFEDRIHLKRRGTLLVEHPAADTQQRRQGNSLKDTGSARLSPI